MQQALDKFRLPFMFCCLAIVGCTAKPPSVSVVSPSPTLKPYTPIAYKINSPLSKVVGESNKIRVVNIMTSTVDSGLFVQVEVLNDRGRRDIVDYRMRWLDSYGMQVVPYEPWSTASFEGKESSVLTFRAPRPNVTDFKFELKNHY